MIGWLLLLFFLGASVGSFLNVLVVRTVEGGDWVRGRSRCDHCQNNLSWYDMVPLLSFLLLRGKSRCCNKPLAMIHPMVEFLMGALFVWWYVMGSVFFQLVQEPLRTMQAGYWLMIGVVLLVVLVMDLAYGLVPTTPVYAAILISIVYRLVILVFGPLRLIDWWEYHLAAFLSWLFFGFLYKVTKGRGMGMGDVILAPLLGLILGYPRTIVALLLAFWLGAIVGVMMVFFKKRTLKQTLPFAPFMIFGAFVSLLWGNDLFGVVFNF